MFSDEDKDSHRPLMRYTFGLNKSNSLMSQNGYLTHKYHHLPRQESTKNAKITINVSGERYQTYVETLNKFPESLLGNKNKRELFYDIIEDEYFFDRDRNAFNAILYYYQSNGQLYCPLTLPMTILVTEAQFFELGNTAIKQVLDIQSEDISSVMPKKKWQRTVWCLFEHPESSKAAKVMTVFSVSMIVLAVTVLCIETLPFFKTETFVIKNEKEHPITVSANVLLRYREHISEINIKEFFSSTVNNSTTLSLGTAQNKQCICSCRCTEMKTESRSEANFNANKTTEAKVFWKETFDILESVFVTWFTAEFILRLISSPNKKKFLTGFLNVVDILSILPFYFTVAIRKHVENVGLDNFRVLRLVRVFRVFKLSRHSKGLQILGQTMKASIKELGMLIFFIGIGVVLFSSTIYYLEVENFNSIPDAFWWAIITMCTVGYGDMVRLFYVDFLAIKRGKAPIFYFSIYKK